MGNGMSSPTSIKKAEKKRCCGIPACQGPLDEAQLDELLRAIETRRDGTPIGKGAIRHRNNARPRKIRSYFKQFYSLPH